jgi:hypothetical protein
MYIFTIHSVSDPRAFWSGQLNLPKGTELPMVVPSEDGTGACAYLSPTPSTRSETSSTALGRHSAATSSTRSTRAGRSGCPPSQEAPLVIDSPIIGGACWVCVCGCRRLGRSASKWRRSRRKPSRARPAFHAQARRRAPHWEFVPLARMTHSDLSSWVRSLTDEGLALATVRYSRASALSQRSLFHHLAHRADGFGLGSTEPQTCIQRARQHLAERRVIGGIAYSVQIPSGKTSRVGVPDQVLKDVRRCVQPPIPQAPPLPPHGEVPLSRYALQRTQIW